MDEHEGHTDLAESLSVGSPENRFFREWIWKEDFSEGKFRFFEEKTLMRRKMTLVWAGVRILNPHSLLHTYTHTHTQTGTMIEGRIDHTNATTTTTKTQRTHQPNNESLSR